MKTKIHFVLISCGAWAFILILILHKLVMILGLRGQSDWLMHYTGGLAAAYVSARTLAHSKAVVGSLTPIGHSLVAFCAGWAIALGWELLEFASDQLLATHIQKSLHETMLDLVYGAAGVVTVITLFSISKLKNRTMPFGRKSYFNNYE